MFVVAPVLIALQSDSYSQVSYLRSIIGNAFEWYQRIKEAGTCVASFVIPTASVEQNLFSIAHHKPILNLLRFIETCQY